MHAIHILMHFKHKLRKCSSNQQDRVNENFPFKSLMFSWNSFSTQQLVDFIVLATPGHATVQLVHLITVAIISIFLLRA